MGITVRNMGKETDALITISKGQFMTSISGDEFLRVKFDDEQPINFSFTSAANGSSEVIFITSTNKFLTKLKTAKKVMVEAPFYDAGRQIGEFSVEGLEWTK